jgi:hypothetical protein
MSTSVNEYGSLSPTESNQRAYGEGRTGAAMWLLIAAAAVLFLR